MKLKDFLKSLSPATSLPGLLMIGADSSGEPKNVNIQYFIQNIGVMTTLDVEIASIPRNTVIVGSCTGKTDSASKPTGGHAYGLVLSARLDSNDCIQVFFSYYFAILMRRASNSATHFTGDWTKVSV